MAPETGTQYGKGQVPVLHGATGAGTETRSAAEAERATLFVTTVAASSAATGMRSATGAGTAMPFEWAAEAAGRST